MDKEKLTVLIVEDEGIITEELERTINWNRLSLEVIGTAEDGVKGEELIKSLSPDIVITDIRLPRQDGLKMIENCKELYQNVIVLSGYTDFSYTRKAIQLGVCDYLQKPVDDDELEEVLSKLSAKIRSEHEDEKKLQGAGKSDGIALPENVKNHQINCVISFIKENYSKPVGLREASEHIKLSENHLSTLFKEVTGINFLQYLNAYRINKSLGLMAKEGMNISEISMLSGFPTPGYFAKIFKRFLGVTPTQYRDGLPLS